MTEYVFGHGPGQTERALDLATHSIYGRSAYEQGVLGLILVSTLMLATLAFAWGLARRDAHVNGVGSAALLGSWLGLIASGFFIDTLHWRHLWVVAALIWVGAASHGVRAASRSGAP
jgi:MFS family permease